MKYVYPDLNGKDLGFFRVGGFGLGNCLFVAARAYLLSLKTGCPLLRPTWERLGFGQFIRHEKDKRFYVGLFKQDSVLSRIKRAFLAHCVPMFSEFDYSGLKGTGCIKVSDVTGFFKPFRGKYNEVRQYFMENIEPSAIAEVPASLKGCIAVHVRLGDYPQKWRTSVSWYVEMIKCLLAHATKPLRILVFSDGSDEELREVLRLPGARRAFFGNALADIIALSRCSLIVGSASTFSSWGTFLGQVPSIYPKFYAEGQYDNLIDDMDLFCLAQGIADLPGEYLERLSLRGII